MKADNGEILWNGIDYQTLGVKYREILGYMPQQQGLYNGFTGKRFLNYIAVLKDIPKKEILLQIEESAKKVNLQNELDKKINMYSGGMKQRLLTFLVYDCNLSYAHGFFSGHPCHSSSKTQTQTLATRNG